MRFICGLALAMLASSPALAKEGSSTKPESQFIDRSVVGYPTLAAGHALIEISYDADHFAGGVGLKYQIANAPANLMFNVFVYPIGELPADRAMKAAMEEMQASFKYAEQQGLYSDVQVGTPVDFESPVSAPSVIEDGDQAEKETEEPAAKPQPPTGGKADAKMLEALRELVAPDRATGKKLTLSYTFNDAPNQSLAYVFYHQLFLIKVRITLPMTDMDTGEFNRRMDQAVRELVPGVRIANFGTCGTMTVYADDLDKEKNGGEDPGIQLIKQMGRIQRSNCANDGPATPPEPGREQTTIVYPPGTWNRDKDD